MNTATEKTKTKAHGYSYQAALAAAQKVNWRIEDIIGGGQRLISRSRLCRSYWPASNRSRF
jgi:hypothetical protein